VFGVFQHIVIRISTRCRVAAGEPSIFWDYV